jgi:predicted nucleic acid-binding protein
MNASFFLDTNLLVYTFDSTAPEKRAIARSLVNRALDGEGCISWQIIQEFSNAALKKFRRPMPIEQLGTYIEKVLLPLCAVWPDERIYREALLIKMETRYSWYDSLITASALRSGAAILYSEDLQNSRSVRGMKITDPFSPAFS